MNNFQSFRHGFRTMLSMVIAPESMRMAEGEVAELAVDDSDERRQTKAEKKREERVKI